MYVYIPEILLILWNNLLNFYRNPIILSVIEKHKITRKKNSLMLHIYSLYVYKVSGKNSDIPAKAYK